MEEIEERGNKKGLTLREMNDLHSNGIPVPLAETDSISLPSTNRFKSRKGRGPSAVNKWEKARREERRKEEVIRMNLRGAEFFV